MTTALQKLIKDDNDSVKTIWKYNHKTKITHGFENVEDRIAFCGSTMPKKQYGQTLKAINSREHFTVRSFSEDTCHNCLRSDESRRSREYRKAKTRRKT